MHISSPSWTSLPPPPTPPLQVVTEQHTELPVLHSSFPLDSYLAHGAVCVHPLSPFAPLSLLPPVSTRLFSPSACLFRPCREAHLEHLSRFHIYALICDIRFSFCLTSLCLADSRSIYITTKDSMLFPSYG